jgi:predicted small lipoprotein YifL
MFAPRDGCSVNLGEGWKLGAGMSLNRMMLIGVAVAALALAGCGRKGMLELPPSANARPPQPAPTEQTTLGEPEHSALDGERTAELPAGRTPQKPFILDWLLK